MAWNWYMALQLPRIKFVCEWYEHRCTLCCYWHGSFFLTSSIPAVLSPRPNEVTSLPADVSSPDSTEYAAVNGGGHSGQGAQQGGRRGDQGRRKYSTWAGKDKRARKKPKRVTNLGQLPALDIDYPRSLKSYNIHQEGSVCGGAWFEGFSYKYSFYCSRRYGLDRATRTRQGSEVSSSPSTQASASDVGDDENGELTLPYLYILADSRALSDTITWFSR